MTITIYTKADCKPCDDVKRILKAEGYEFNAVPANFSRETARILRDAKVDGYPAIFKGMDYLGSGLLAVHKIDPDINIAKYF